MPNTTIGPGAGAKKETIYGGPTSNSNPGTVYSGPAAGGTVYQGPGLNGAAVPQRSAAARPVRSQTQAVGTKAGGIFFTIAAFSALNTLLVAFKAPFILAIGLAVTRVRMDGALGPALVLSTIAIGIFVGLGFAASRGSKPAFIIGMVLYAGDTVLLLLSANPAMHMMSIIVHGLFLFSMFKALQQLN